MRRNQLMVIALIMAACASPAVSTDADTTTSTLDATTTTTTAAPDTTGPPAAAAEEDPVGYLTEMTNLAADYLDRESGFGSTYTEDNPQPDNDEEQLEYIVGYYVGGADIGLEHAAAVEAIEPPAMFAEAHRRYVVALRTVHEERKRVFTGFTTFGEYQDWLAEIHPVTGASGALADALDAYIVACAAMETTAAQAGYELDLQCPEPPPEAIEVRIEAGDQWVATPASLPADADLITLEITNIGTEPIRPVVLDIFEGDPLDLPVGEGVVDIALSGVSDPSSGYASFGLAYPNDLFGDDSRLTDVPPELAPGKTVTTHLFVSGHLVVFDYRAGQFEAGRYVVVDKP